MKRHAFTLIELLVVISIIALLTAILLPALGRARRSAQALQCLSNLRQMAAAATRYTDTFDGYFPPAYRYHALGSESWEIHTHNGPPVTHSPGSLWFDGGTPAVQQCPAFDGPDAWTDAPYTGYNYNTSFLGHGQFEAIPRPARMTEVRAPSACVIFGDGQWAGGANKFMRSPLPNPGDSTSPATRAAAAQGFRHDDNTNASFVDGHGETLNERFTAGNPHLAPGTGFLSEDNTLYDLE